MRAYVFTDKSLASEAGRFVWLAMDGEKKQNAALRKSLDLRAFPTYYVVDPATEKVALRWVGGATVPQLHKLLADGRVAVAAAGKKPEAASSGQASADQLFAVAEQAYAQADYAAAAAGYQQALARAPASWPHYGRAVESALFALGETQAYATSAALARDAWPRLRHTSSSANVAATGLDAVLSLPDSSAQRRRLIPVFEGYGREILADPTIPLAGDDRSAVYIALLDARKDANDAAGAHGVAEEWARFLEGEAAKATTPDARAVYDSHRLAAYLELGEPERAIPMLQASERDLPDDYNPPARLATAYKAMKRWSDALAASDRALQKAYGPRTLLILQTRADIYVGLGDSLSARQTVASALATAEALPPGQRSENTIATLKKRLAAMGGSVN